LQTVADVESDSTVDSNGSLVVKGVLPVDLNLRNKVAVITGGSIGIGLAVGQGLAREGVHVVLCARDEARVNAQAKQITMECGVKALGLKADVTNVEDILRVVAEVKKMFGGADILFNNAGTGTDETIMNAPDSKWQHYWDLHVMAAIRLARELIPTMQQRGGGVILNNASICAKQPIYREPIYNVTKAALVMFSKCLANEVIKDNIRVNCINPGLIQTEPWEQWAKQAVADNGQSWEDHLTQVAKELTPIGRFATPEELADFIVFMCSDRASYCVGSTYYVDGGWLNVVS
jgi:NAD(P)-dependent dehydrogenase (short-subunit alcohol dehydrogenase family)